MPDSLGSITVHALGRAVGDVLQRRSRSGEVICSRMVMGSPVGRAARRSAFERPHGCRQLQVVVSGAYLDVGETIVGHVRAVSVCAVASMRSASSGVPPTTVGGRESVPDSIGRFIVMDSIFSRQALISADYAAAFTDLALANCALNDVFRRPYSSVAGRAGRLGTQAFSGP